MATRKKTKSKLSTNSPEVPPAPPEVEVTEPKGAQVAKGLEGIEFADEPREESMDPRANAEPPPKAQTAETNALNQAAARRAIQDMQRRPSKSRKVRPHVPAPTEEEVIRTRPKVYQVMSSAEIPRGSARYRLTPGKMITENEYDIAGLRAMGVQLQEIEG